MSSGCLGRGGLWPGWILLLLLLGGLLLGQLGGVASFHSVVSHNNQHVKIVQDHSAIWIGDPRLPHAWLLIQAGRGGFLKAEMGDRRSIVWCVRLVEGMVDWRATLGVNRRNRAFRHCDILMAVMPARTELNYPDASLWLEAHGFMESPELPLASWLASLPRDDDDDDAGADIYEYSVITMHVSNLVSPLPPPSPRIAQGGDKD